MHHLRSDFDVSSTSVLKEHRMVGVVKQGDRLHCLRIIWTHSGGNSIPLVGRCPMVVSCIEWQFLVMPLVMDSLHGKDPGHFCSEEVIQTYFAFFHSFPFDFDSTERLINVIPA